MEDPLTVDLVLVPVDGSDESITAAQFATKIARAYDGRVHAMYVLGEEIARAVKAGVINHSEAVAEGQSVLDAVRAIAETEDIKVTDSTACGFSVESLTVHPGSVILDAADQMDADFIVIPRESTSDATVLERAAEYVLLYASQPVLSV